MKCFVISVLLFFSLSGLAQLPIDWGAIAQGAITAYQKYNIKSLRLKKEGYIIKMINFNPEENEITILDQKQNILYALYYDKQNRLTKIVKSNKELYIKYFKNDTIIQSQLLKTSGLLTDTLQIVTFPYKENLKLIQNEFYVISSTTKDTINQNYFATIPNLENDNWSYELKRIKGWEEKRYKNGISVTKDQRSGFTEYDSIVPQSNLNPHLYQSRIFPDSVYMSVTTDATYDKTLVSGKLVYERMSSIEGNDQYEIYYAKDSTILKKIFFIYYPDSDGKTMLWKKITLNGQGKKIKTEYPNKKEYKIKNGIIKRKRGYPKQALLSCEGAIVVGTFGYDNFWMPSSSILFLPNIETDSLHERIMINLSFYHLMDGEIYYGKWQRVYIDPSSVKTDNPINVLSKEIIFPGTDIPVQENKYQIEMTTRDGSVRLSPLYENIHKLPIIFNLVVFKSYRKF